MMMMPKQTTNKFCLPEVVNKTNTK